MKTTVDTADAGIKLGEEALQQVATKREQFVEKQFEREHPDLAEKSKSAKSKLDTVVEEEEKIEKEVKEQPVEETKEESEEAAESESKPAEEQQTEEEAKPEEEESENKKETVKPSLEDVMKVYAEKNGITIEEAKADFEANDGVLKKYMDNPETFPHELAKAYRNQQAEYTKSKEHQKQVNANNFASQIIADPKGFINKALDANKDKLLKDFRENNPERSNILTDGAILEELREKGLANLKIEIQNYQSKTQKDAGQKRESLVSSLKDADKPFAAEIKSMLYKLPDSQVADPTFNFKDLIRWAKGDDVVISKMIKDAEDKGYQRAMQEKKILGDANTSKSGATGKTKPKVESKQPTLSGYDQKKAMEMFGSVYQTREECYAAYDEVVLKRKKIMEE